MQDCKGQRAIANRKLKQPLRLFGSEKYNARQLNSLNVKKRLNRLWKISPRPLSVSNCNKINCIIDVVFNLKFFNIFWLDPHFILILNKLIHESLRWANKLQVRIIKTLENEALSWSINWLIKKFPAQTLLCDPTLWDPTLSDLPIKPMIMNLWISEATSQ